MATREGATSLLQRLQPRRESFQVFQGRAHRLGENSPILRSCKRPTSASPPRQKGSRRCKGPNSSSSRSAPSSGPLPEDPIIIDEESQGSSIAPRDPDDSFFDCLIPDPFQSSNGEEYDSLIAGIQHQLHRAEKVVLVVQGLIARIVEHDYNKEILEELDDFAMGTSMHLTVGHDELLKYMAKEVDARNPDDQDETYDYLSELLVDVKDNAKVAERKLRHLQKVAADFIEPIAVDKAQEKPREVDKPLQSILKQRSLSRQSSAASSCARPPNTQSKRSTTSA